MKKLYFIAFIFLLFTIESSAQIMLGSMNWKFKTGDAEANMKPELDDKNWENIKVGKEWEVQGHPNYDGIAWYRVHFTLSSSLKDKSVLKDSIHILIGQIDDEDQCFLNGKLVGSNGANAGAPPKEGPVYRILRDYTLASSDAAIRWDGDNVLAVRVNDTGGKGGMSKGPYLVRMEGLEDHLTWSTDHEAFSFKGQRRVEKQIKLVNSQNRAVKGDFSLLVQDGSNTVDKVSKSVEVPANSFYSYLLSVQGHENTVAKFSFKEARSGAMIYKEVEVPYILTPVPSDAPRINGAKIIGARVGHPFLFTIPATGKRPMRFNANGLPEGLKLDPATGIISGQCSQSKRSTVKLKAKNSLGEASSDLTIVIGSKIGLTPAMGWNSWNAFGISVNTSHVKDAVNAMVEKGLIQHGFTYINIDDGWQEEKRDISGNIRSNEKFADMKELTDFIHAHGLKAGLYSSPGPKTCGGFTGSWGHEAQDVLTWAQWGFDYIKYDWCSYGEIDTTVHKTIENYARPYRLLQKSLEKSERDIYYSLCQYGMGKVWQWGAEVGGNSWRTTGDIRDTWKSMSSIGFRQNVSSGYSKPGGGWNDPDMLVIGNVGWGPNLHASRLSPNEQYTHISLWSLLSAPLLIGCDMASLDPFTLNLISNDEVLAIDQDSLGKQAERVISTSDYQVWVKRLGNGKKAIGVFNLTSKALQININWASLKIPSTLKIRDVWRQKYIGKTNTEYAPIVPAHGVRLVRVE